MFRKTLAIAAFGMICGSSALADTPAQARKTIEAIYTKEMAAFSRRDVDSVFAYQTPDYVAITKEGKRYPREQANQMARQLTMAKKVSAKSSIVSFSLKGDTALVRSKSNLTITIADPQTGKLMSGTIAAVEEDVWVKTGGKWLLKQSKEIAMTRKMLNGK